MNANQQLKNLNYLKMKNKHGGRRRGTNSFENMTDEEKRLKKVAYQKEYDKKNKAKTKIRKERYYEENKYRLELVEVGDIAQYLRHAEQVEQLFVGKPSHNKLCKLLKIKR